MSDGRSVPNDKSCPNYLKKVGFVTFVFILGFSFAILHFYHVATMFENSRHFSHLSPLEREMSLKTEMGLYYSYYKTIVDANFFSQGIKSVMQDKLIEYPDSVNALKRFNIYPEVVAGYLFHVYSHYCNIYNIENKQCWSIKRNGFSGEVISCEGPGEPIYFYLMFVWVLAGFTVLLIFIYSLYLSKSICGAILAVSCYFFNHGEATRIQWAPPLRENFAFPFILLNMMTVTYMLRKMTTSPSEIRIIQIWILGISGCVCLMLWQFSQFVLLSQLVLLFFMEQLRILSRHLFFLLLCGHLISIYLAVIVMQGNKMLISSFYLAVTCSMSFNHMFWDLFYSHYRTNRINSMSKHLLHVAKNFMMILCLTFAFKLKFTSLVGSEDDSHILQLLRSKLTSFRNFHTMLYTCSSEFDYLPVSSIFNLSYTLLLPCATIAIFLIFKFWIQNASRELNKVENKIDNKKGKKVKAVEKKLQNSLYELSGDKKDSTAKIQLGKVEETSKKSTAIARGSSKQSEEIPAIKSVPEKSFFSSLIKITRMDPEVMYNILQLIVYFAMAILIMRLKLFLTPQLCVIASLAASSKYNHRFMKCNTRVWPAFVLFITLTAMSLKGFPNISAQRNIVGEFTDEPLEQLITWINRNTEKTAAFAGPMPLTAAIMLSTRRPIVNHPQYEDANLRARTFTVYKMFSRHSALELYVNLSKLRVTYIVIDELWCFHKSSNGCTMLDIWDVEEPELKESPPLCTHLFSEKQIPHFHRVFSNSQYVVLKLHDNAVNIKIRNYETFSM